MDVIIPGHKYELSVLDGAPGDSEILNFVMRKGPKFPGNEYALPGTTLQEVLRACIDRVRYLDGQMYSLRNTRTLSHLENAVFELEARAAEQHGRPVPILLKACYGEQCIKCLHVECTGNCHASTT